jgi:hypothetical protein
MDSGSSVIWHRRATRPSPAWRTISSTAPPGDAQRDRRQQRHEQRVHADAPEGALGPASANTVRAPLSGRQPANTLLPKPISVHHAVLPSTAAIRSTTSSRSRNGASSPPQLGGQHQPVDAGPAQPGDHVVGQPVHRGTGPLGERATARASSESHDRGGSVDLPP